MSVSAVALPLAGRSVLDRPGLGAGIAGVSPRGEGQQLLCSLEKSGASYTAPVRQLRRMTVTSKAPMRGAVGAPSSGGEDSFRAPLAAEVRRCLGMTSMTIPAGARQVCPQPQGGFDSPKTLGLGTLYTATFLNFPAASGSGRPYPVAARVLTSKRLRWKRRKPPNLERYTSSVRVLLGVVLA